MSESRGPKVMISYSSKNVGKHPVRGMRTKEYYGYRRRGDQFEVYESDARTRPDLFVPIGPVDQGPPSMPSHRGRPQEAANVLGAKAVAEAVQTPPAPPAILEIVEGTVPNEPDPYELPPPLEMKPGEDVVTRFDYDPRDNIHNVVLDFPLETLDWEGKINKKHLSLLAENDILTLGDLIPLTEDNVLSIKGIGPGVTRALFSKMKENNF